MGDEEVELDADKRRYVDETYAALDRLNHYELVGVPRDADKKAIKRAYFALAATIHPDRHFGKKLGSYKAKMEVIFARVTAAFDVISDRDKRPAYDRTLPPMKPGAAPAQAAPAQAPKPPVDPKTLAKRQEAMEALKARFADAKGRVKQQIEQAQRARAAGDLAAASDLYRQALVIVPDDEEVGNAYAEVQKLVAERLVESFVKKATMEERFERWQDAADSWKRVLLARPDDHMARERHLNARGRAAKG